MEQTLGSEAWSLPGKATCTEKQGGAEQGEGEPAQGRTGGTLPLVAGPV